LIIEKESKGFGSNKEQKYQIRYNENINAQAVQVIDADGNSLGEMSLREGLSAAMAVQLDLVEIVPNATPPVCKIMSYDQYRYAQQKKAKEAKKKQKVVETKEIKIRPNIAENDYQVKLKRILQFIGEGNKVMVSLMFRGREASHNEIGFALMQRYQNDTEHVAKAESAPKMEGKRIFMVLVPK
jgi:translation initiation factor IF-3